MNKTLLNILKKTLDESKGKWPEILPSALWAYRTTPHLVTGESPFSLCFEVKALVPVEQNVPSARVVQVDSKHNSKLMQEALNDLEERRRNTLLQLENYQWQAS